MWFYCDEATATRQFSLSLCHHSDKAQLLFFCVVVATRHSCPVSVSPQRQGIVVISLCRRTDQAWFSPFCVVIATRHSCPLSVSLCVAIATRHTCHLSVSSYLIGIVFTFSVSSQRQGIIVIFLSSQHKVTMYSCHFSVSS